MTWTVSRTTDHTGRTVPPPRRAWEPQPVSNLTSSALLALAYISHEGRPRGISQPWDTSPPSGCSRCIRSPCYTLPRAYFPFNPLTSSNDSGARTSVASNRANRLFLASRSAFSRPPFRRTLFETGCLAPESMVLYAFLFKSLCFHLARAHMLRLPPPPQNQTQIGI